MRVVLVLVGYKERWKSVATHGTNDEPRFFDDAFRKEVTPKVTPSPLALEAYKAGHKPRIRRGAVIVGA